MAVSVRGLALMILLGTLACRKAPETRDAELRRKMVADIAASGLVSSRPVLERMQVVPRHAFAPELSLPAAYANQPQPIGHQQTISQPLIVAMMTEALALSGSERVLEIGTGSGYHAAVMAGLAREVYSIEIVPELGISARTRLAQLGYANVHVRIGDGYQGWPEAAPFDRIVLTAAPPEVPQALIDQLREGGILVAPVGEAGETQQLLRITKTRAGLEREDLGAVRFVPMVDAPAAKK